MSDAERRVRAESDHCDSCGDAVVMGSINLVVPGIGLFDRCKGNVDRAEQLAEALALLRDAREIAHWDGTGRSRDLLGRIDAVLGNKEGR